MSTCSVAETKNNLSAILADLSSGAEVEHIIEKRGKPVAVIHAYTPKPRPVRKFGFAKGRGKAVDWDAFNALDEEIAREFGL